MHVVLGVARLAAARLLHPAARRLAVARAAGEALVGSVQGERRLRVVIEAPDAPAVRHVTAPAIVAEPSLVVVVSGVTRGTVRIRVREALAAMAVLARDQRVEPEQGEFRQPVIE